MASSGEWRWPGRPAPARAQWRAEPTGLCASWCMGRRRGQPRAERRETGWARARKTGTWTCRRSDWADLHWMRAGECGAHDAETTDDIVRVNTGMPATIALVYTGGLAYREAFSAFAPYVSCRAGAPRAFACIPPPSAPRVRPVAARLACSRPIGCGTAWPSRGAACTSRGSCAA